MLVVKRDRDEPIRDVVAVIIEALGYADDQEYFKELDEDPRAVARKFLALIGQTPEQLGWE